MRLFKKKASSFDELNFVKSKKDIIDYVNFILKLLEETDKVKIHAARNTKGKIVSISIYPFYYKTNRDLDALIQSIENDLQLKETPMLLESIKNFKENTSEKEIRVYNDAQLSDTDFYEMYHSEVDQDAVIKRTENLYTIFTKLLKDLLSFINSLEFRDSKLYSGDSNEYEQYRNTMIGEMGQLGLNVEILSPIKKETFVNIKDSFAKTLNLIKASPLDKFFDYTRNVSVVFGTEAELGRSGGGYSAYYSDREDKLYVHIERSDKHLVRILIHEFAHRFHKLGIIDGFSNEDIDSLYLDSQYETKCFISSLPKIGDSLTDLNFKPFGSLGDVWWSRLKYSSDYLTVSEFKDMFKDYILTKIINDKYTYTNKKTKKSLTIDKMEILKSIRCPSDYGSKDEREFFAEMCTLITLGVQSPSQKWMVGKFISIVNNQS